MAIGDTSAAQAGATAPPPQLERPAPTLVLGLAALGALVMGSYEIARPAADSLYLTSFGKDRLPLVWLAVAASAALGVGLYNRAAAHVPLRGLFTWVCALTAVALTALLGLRSVWPQAAVFLLYVWKDLYVVFLVEMFWTLANHTFRHSSARWLYGLFGAAGTVGSLAGSQTVAWLCRPRPALGSLGGLSTVQLLWLVLPILGLLLLGFWLMQAQLPAAARTAAGAVSVRPAAGGPDRPAVSWRQAFAVMRGNRLLGLMVALICCTQVTITLIDYQYNGAIAAHAADADGRTRLMSQVNMAMNGSALVLQLGAGLLLRLLGVRWILLGIPMALGAALASWMALPRLLTIVVAKVASKAFDYSIFRATKELLYLPLRPDEKTQGKAVVDIMTYRVAKAAAALLLLALVALSATGLAPALTAVVLACWLGVVVALTRTGRGDPAR